MPATDLPRRGIPDATVAVTYTGDFNDSAKAKEAAPAAKARAAELPPNGTAALREIAQAKLDAVGGAQ